MDSKAREEEHAYSIVTGGNLGTGNVRILLPRELSVQAGMWAHIGHSLDTYWTLIGHYIGHYIGHCESATRATLFQFRVLKSFFYIK